MAKVSLNQITREFGSVIAVSDITFEIPDGEFWVLVGPSGCGKSTILRMIAGLESITKGEIYIGNTLVNLIPPRQRDVAMVFQNYALYPHMTIAQNLSFGLRMRKVDPVTQNRRVESVARSLNIEHLLQRKPKQLSGGQQQRVALGRAMIREPKAFLLDEPLSNLDAQLRDETRAFLKQLHGQLGITTIYVTHDQVEAMTLADKIVILDEGKIQQIGTPQTIYHRPINRMVATFIGSPTMNILPAIYSQDNLSIQGQLITLSEFIKKQISFTESSRFEVGIRPENISLSSSFKEGQFLAIVEAIEPLGRDNLVRVVLPNSEIKLNLYTPFSWTGKLGDRLRIYWSLDHLFIFDSFTGKTLYP
ncbi:sugar ABC transporter ATP-binding protein [Aphanothece hegewaldii CCALA 016]|uniref:Sugar ABC transporter ATP-binding protein n=1 Tax=Aphanothece hegewaldii CCALA 016 TaxID=2107694 RepID=A0A2T1LSP1_9CHRO|nr:sn-glycerol-3-phosphate ABC transporter ATP-binding protein UgpC [Aphanothece hegewaldii]PSF33073.1 sugar ABC transporter ATP-binding protein [Aphanothece hegewaldii CCALA 016]